MKLETETFRSPFYSCVCVCSVMFPHNPPSTVWSCPAATSEVPRANAWLSKLLLLPKLEPKAQMRQMTPESAPLRPHTHQVRNSGHVMACASLRFTVHHSGIQFASALLCSFCKVAPYGPCDVLVQMTMLEVHREPRSGDRMYLPIRE